MIELSQLALRVSQYTAAKTSKLKIQVLIFSAGHWEIKVLLIDWTCLVCTFWNLIKRRPWKVTIDIGIQAKQVEPRLIYLTVFSLQRIFSWVETHSHGFVQFPTPSPKASWVYHIQWEDFSGVTVAAVLAASFWQSMQPHNDHLILLSPKTKHFHWLSKRQVFIRGNLFFPSTVEESRQNSKNASICSRSGDLHRAGLSRTVGVGRRAGLCLNMEWLLFPGSTHCSFAAQDQHAASEGFVQRKW